MKTLEDKKSFEITIPGSRPDKGSKKLSEYDDRLPNITAWKHQEETAEKFAQGYNIVLSSGLASGKTEAALAALSNANSYPALFIYPTRALAADQHERFKKYGYKTTIADSDHSYWRKRNPGYFEIVLSNPEFIWQHVKHDYSFSEWIDSFKAIVIDEIHMYNSRELCKLLGIIRTVSDRVICLSATIGNINEVCQEITKATGTKTVPVLGESMRSKRTYIGYKNADWDDIIDIVEMIKNDNRKAIIFFPTRNTAERFYIKLINEIDYEAYLHHGALPRKERKQAERGFKESESSIMVTVKTLQQGIDIGEVDTIIHTHLPPRVSDFHQRDGRAGRRKGIEALSVVLGTDKWSNWIVKDKKRFEEYYLKAEPEKLLLSAHSSLSKPIKENTSKGFYSGETFKLIYNKKEIMRIDILDIPYKFSPGCILMSGMSVLLITGIDMKNKLIFARRDPIIEKEVLSNKLWFQPIISTKLPEINDENTLTIGEIIIKNQGVILKDLEKNEPVQKFKTNIKISGTALMYLHKPDYGTLEEWKTAAHAIHIIVRKAGYPIDSFRHTVTPQGILFYDMPPSGMHMVFRDPKLIDITTKTLEKLDIPEHIPICPHRTSTEEIDMESVKYIVEDIIHEICLQAQLFDETLISNANARIQIEKSDEQKTLEETVKTTEKDQINIGSAINNVNEIVKEINSMFPEQKIEEQIDNTFEKIKKKIDRIL
ncbi:MAG: DEAD/DEAH box helicase [Crenarchaeota archaeon]|nr:DEAD/DEAH box helicase [Thermoproteota archaeon]